MLKLYYHLMSQPSRALYIVLKMAKIPFESITVDLPRGEHLTPEFKEKHSKFQKVPFIHDGDFRLTESIAILRYVARQHNLPDHWYPKDAKKQASVDEYLEWQHNNIRAFCAMFFMKTKIFPVLTGEQPSPQTVEKLKNSMVDSLDKFEELFLGNKLFITGDKLSFADIIAACEIEQPRMSNFEPREGRPKLAAWIERVRNECNPHYDEAHLILNKIAKKSQAKL